MSKPREKVMLVDDNITNLAVGKNALVEQYDVYTVPSGDKFFKILEMVEPDLILLDVEMPVMNGYEVIKKLKADPARASIPVIFLTAKSDMHSELEGLSLGAVDYIAKPFSPPLLLKRVETQLLLEAQRRELQRYNSGLQKMVEEKTRAVADLQTAVFDLLTEVVEYRDDETGGHVSRTSIYFQIMVDSALRDAAFQDEILSWDIRMMVLSSRLHDIGKIAIRDSILLKPGKLTPEEFETMKLHTIYGADIIEKIEKSSPNRSFIDHAKVMALTHHEKWDGSGYPHGLAGADIPLAGRIMAIVDVYDALRSKRPYKMPISSEQAAEIIIQGSGTHFDPQLVEVFREVAASFEKVSDLA
ncbi:MAG: response regulator [Deltaproteobacteria bacterium]|nr:response regulator [Deltaproteobacteria bacterium]